MQGVCSLKERNEDGTEAKLTAFILSLNSDLIDLKNIIPPQEKT